LLLRGGPLDVPRFIVAVIIDAVKRVSRRTISDFSNDIGNEFNGIEPLWGFDSTAAIVFISFIARVVASLNHSFPDAIERVPLSVSSVAVAIKS
jgi:hypothetical protein